MGQGVDDAGQLLVGKLKDVHHRALPGLQVVRVRGRAGCLRYAGSLVRTRERGKKANASTYRGGKLSVSGTALLAV